MLFLKYYQGANPGKKRKNATPSEEEKKLQQQKYEEHRPERKFSNKWLVGRPWLMYDIPDKSAMFCNWCIDYNNTYVNNNFKKNMNTFITGCKNFRLSTIADHESSRIHINASAFAKSKTRGSQEPVIVQLVFNLTSKVDRKWGCYT
jgi:hypothetical protein